MFVTASWARAGLLAYLVLLLVLVDKVKALILNFFLLDLKVPLNEDKMSCFRLIFLLFSGDRKVLS